MLIPTICFNCEVGCGLLAYVDKDTQQIRKFEGNPAYPGSRGRNCARGPATINQVHDPERKIPYEDPELGFCILAHAYSGAKDSPPHDHGPTWAIYGQGIGETEMTDWELVTPATQDTPGKVRKAKVYTLNRWQFCRGIGGNFRAMI